MPNIVRAQGVNLTGEVFRVRDIVPHRPKLQKPALKPEEGFLISAPEEDFAPEFGGNAGTVTAAEEQFRILGDDSRTAGEEEERPVYHANYSAGQNSAQHPLQGEIIQSAMAEAGRILEDAVKRAEATRSEMLAQVEYEIEQRRAKAEDEGRRQGYESVLGEVKEAAASLEQAIAHFEGERASFEAELEGQLKWLAVEIASKVLAKKVREDDAELLEMVDKAVQGLKSENWVRVEVSAEMQDLISRLQALYAGVANIDVQAVDSVPGSVAIETPSGIVDASLHTQLDNLREYFETAKV